MGCADGGEDLLKKHQDLCHALNMDKETAYVAWQSYDSIRQNYTLEGDQLHWLGCSLYVACRKSVAPTVSKASTLVEGNLVSLTRLLRLCNLSLLQFFNKSKKWADMTNLSPEFRDKLNRLERNYNVSNVIFKKFRLMFNDMFVEPTIDQPRQNKTKKQRTLPCTSSRLFDFVWTLYVSVKSENPDSSDDLVSCVHLLLSCCDLIFANAVMADRTDLINNKFPGVPKNYGERCYKPPTEPPCVMYHLCQKYASGLVEAKRMKEYFWKNHMKRFFDRKILQGDPKTFSGLLDLSNFENNLKACNKLYEEYVLSVGDFDERIFLVKCKEAWVDKPRPGPSYKQLSPDRPALRTLNFSAEDTSNKMGTPTKILESDTDTSEQSEIRHSSSVSQLTPATPLTGRRYLKAKDPGSLTPVSTATQSVQRLQNLLSGRSPAPSPYLQQLISSCSDDPQIVDRIKSHGQKFISQYTQSAQTHIDFAQQRLQLAETLYYKLLENILKDEMKKPNFDCNNLLCHEVFHQTLFACCLEIVIYSYNSQRTFPWVLQALGVEPYHFYKVIEVTVRAEEQLSRDMVKHLNLIEEQILESLVWKRESPLWDAIDDSGLPVPCCEDVMLPGQLTEDNSSATLLNNPAIRRLVLPAVPGVPQSPAPSASERFHSPVTATSAIAKKKLFIDNSRGVCTVMPGQSILAAAPKPPVAAGEEAETKKPQTGSSVIINPAMLKERQTKPNRPRRTGSLGLFFRKFYHLAAVRMQELCTHLDLKETEVRRKIWTCFEHSIIDHTDLMLDRHLDQILMCAVYVICKIEGLDKPFTEVMKCYRLQPQAGSHVYRSVLLYNRPRTGQRTNNNNCSDNGQEPASASVEVLNESENRCDIIKFYNSVYVLKLQNFVRKFTNGNNQNGNLTLSPLPVSRGVPMSPRRRVSDNHAVFIRPLISSEPNVFPPSPTRPLSYCFSRSPAKDLRAINCMLGVRRVGKRLLTDDATDDEAAAPVKQPNLFTNKLQDLLVDRRMAKGQDSA
ncbi:retinoblastoma-like protein 1 isoform X1 [Macrosteles quadrilineatus]|uniref:retinoblastoma-like protein 1 isoform X1 n=1 Tax=Macrosteles quadrilineatus TaxID=74068 RepID=UPI0023E16A79|nr:retinoblastoma-like protein 1 isoform X1 [Macrosteles quadrilineatus]